MDYNKCSGKKSGHHNGGRSGFNKILIQDFSLRSTLVSPAISKDTQADQTATEQQEG